MEKEKRMMINEGKGVELGKINIDRKRLDFG